MRWADARIKDWCAAVVGPKILTPSVPVAEQSKRAESQNLPGHSYLEFKYWDFTRRTGYGLAGRAPGSIGWRGRCHHVPILGVGAECRPSNAAGVRRDSQE